MLSNSIVNILLTEMCKQTIDFTELYSKILEIDNYYFGTVRVILMYSSVKSIEFIAYPQFPNYSVILRENLFSMYDARRAFLSSKLCVRSSSPTLLFFLLFFKTIAFRKQLFSIFFCNKVHGK